MALKSTVYKALIQIADMDRGLYTDRNLTLAKHPSETDERLMMRLLAYIMGTPADDLRGTLDMAAGLSDTDQPDLWQRDLTGQLVQWIEVGLPDDRRLVRSCAKAEQVTLWAYGSSANVWWSGIENKLHRLGNLTVWQVPAAQSAAMAGLVERSMQLQATVQEGHVWLGNGKDAVTIEPSALKQPREDRRG